MERVQTSYERHGILILPPVWVRIDSMILVASLPLAQADLLEEIASSPRTTEESSFQFEEE